MRIDIHCHVVGKGRNIDNSDNEVFFNADDNQHWFTRILYNLLEDDIVRMGADLDRDGTISTDEYLISLIAKGITFSEYTRIIKTENPLDRDVRIKRAYGFSDSILGNAVKVLRGLKE